MNKVKLVEIIANKTRSTKKNIENIIDEFENAIIEELKNSGKVVLTGFGQFEVITSKQREGVNPRNVKERIQIPPVKTPKFRAGKRFKDEIRK